MCSRISPVRPQGYYIDLREKAELPEWPPAWWPYPGWHRYIALGQWGLGHYERFILGEGEEWLESALMGGDHLVETQLSGKLDGAWHEPEDYPHTFQVPGPWVSAMAQGLCASFLTRLYVTTGREEFAETARRAVRAMKIPTEAGGCSAPLDGAAFPEEYPTTPPSFVLNGAIYAVYGVIDVALATGDEEARRQADEMVDAISTNLHRWDLGYWSRYDLFPHRVTNIASASYHTLHVNQLRALQLVAPRPELEETADRWAGYAASRVCRTRALAAKVFFRLVIPRNRIGRRLPWVHRTEMPPRPSPPGEDEAPSA